MTWKQNTGQVRHEFNRRLICGVMRVTDLGRTLMDDCVNAWAVCFGVVDCEERLSRALDVDGSLWGWW